MTRIPKRHNPLRRKNTPELVLARNHCFHDRHDLYPVRARRAHHAHFLCHDREIPRDSKAAHLLWTEDRLEKLHLDRDRSCQDLWEEKEMQEKDHGTKLRCHGHDHDHGQIPLD